MVWQVSDGRKQPARPLLKLEETFFENILGIFRKKRGEFEWFKKHKISMQVFTQTTRPF